MEHQISSYYHCFPDYDDKDFLQFHWHYDKVVEKLNSKKKGDMFSPDELVSKFRS